MTISVSWPSENLLEDAVSSSSLTRGFGEGEQALALTPVNAEPFLGSLLVLNLDPGLRAGWMVHRNDARSDA